MTKQLTTTQQLIPETEKTRLNALLAFEAEARSQGFRSIAGVDEAGRGPLAGPVVAAACILPEGLLLNGLNDSKKLTEKRREQLFQEITSNPNIVYSVGIADARLIDEINIYQATIHAMIAAVDGLGEAADYLLVDGLALPHPHIPGLKIIKGDAKSLSIAAASVLAKVTRDHMMLEYAEKWPELF